MKLTPILFTTTAALAITASTHAALITWGAATNINPAGGAASDLDVSTAGTLVGAFNLGATGVANATINGVTFTGLPLSGFNVTSGNFNFAAPGFLASANGLGSPLAPFSNLSASYQSLLSSFTNSDGPITLAMSALAPDATYQFQWWNDGSNAAFPALLGTSATAGNTVTLKMNTTGAAGGLGQFAIGTFVADGSGLQSIVFAGDSGAPRLNGFQLRQIAAPPAVPEPGTALAGVVLAGLCGTLRRRPP